MGSGCSLAVNHFSSHNGKWYTTLGTGLPASQVTEALECVRTPGLRLIWCQMSNGESVSVQDARRYPVRNFYPDEAAKYGVNAAIVLQASRDLNSGDPATLHSYLPFIPEWEIRSLLRVLDEYGELEDDDAQG